MLPASFVQNLINTSLKYFIAAIVFWSAGGVMKKSKTSANTAVSVDLIIHHPLALRYIRDLLQKKSDFHVFINTTQHHTPTTSAPRVAILDSEALPSIFTRYVANLRVQLPDSRLLVLGHELSDIEICQLLLLGIHGFIAYDRLEKDLVLGVRKLWDNHLMVPPRILEKFAQYASSMKRRTPNDPPFKFSARQRIALDLLQQGLSNKEIATAMQVSPRTVKFHLSNIFSKIGIHDRHSLADMMRAATPLTVVNKQGDPDAIVDGMLRVENKMANSPIHILKPSSKPAI
jgi:DNA-binding NarL/FixJ family response regulator